MTGNQDRSIEDLFDHAMASPFDEVPIDVDDLFEPQIMVDIAPLLTLIGQEEALPDSTFIQTWLDWSNNSGFMRREEAIQTLSRLAYQVSKYYRHQPPADEVSKYLEVSWLRLSADWGYLNALLDLSRQALNELPPRKLHLVKHWVVRVIEQIKQTGYYSDDVKLESQLNQLNLLIHKLADVHPSTALDLSFRLMEVIQKHTNLYAIDDELSANTDKIMARMNGVRVLDSIEESSDRTIRDTIKRYQGLVRHPVPLQSIGETSSLQQTLDDRFPWFSKLTQKIINALLLRKMGSGVLYLPPMLIVGSPGIGKTSYLRALGDALNIPSQIISMAGKSDNRDLVGTARGWSTGHPSMAIRLIHKHQVANPMIILDELEKCGGSDQNGRALDTLLTLLEPASATAVFDEYLCGHADLSHISWVATANEVRNIPSTLLSRLEVVKLDPPKPEHYPAIVNSSIRSVCQRNGIHPGQAPVPTDTDWQWLKQSFTSPRKARKATETWLGFRLLNGAGYPQH